MTFTAQMRLTIFLYFVLTVITVGIVSYAAGASNERANAPRDYVVTEEDGSGIQYINHQRVRVFDEDTFAWDCATMGNESC